METTSRLDGSQPFEKSARRCPSAFLREKIGGYVVLGLVFVFFAIPFVGISVHYHKYGVPPRFLGLVGFFSELIRSAI